MNVFTKIELKIKKEISNSILIASKKKELKTKKVLKILLEIPPVKKFGDYSTNIAMILSNEENKKPGDIANILIKYFNKKKANVYEIKFEKPGFINIFLEKKYLKNIIKEILNKKEKYGYNNYFKNKKINIEFVSANPTGLLHMGNARGAVIGDVLGNILKFLGANVTKEYYINDKGKQIEIFSESLELRYRQVLGFKINFNKEGYRGEDIIDTVKKYINKKDKSKNLLKKNIEERRKILCKYALNEKINAIKKDLEKFGVFYDVWFKESNISTNKNIKKILNIFNKKNFLYKKDNATWIKTSILGEKKDEVLIRSNGIPTYFSSDIAYHKNKFDRGFDKIINVWGADHHDMFLD